MNHGIEELSHFPNVAAVAENVREANPEQFCVYLDQVAIKFYRHFQEMLIEGLIKFITNPFFLH